MSQVFNYQRLIGDGINPRFAFRSYHGWIIEPGRYQVTINYKPDFDGVQQGTFTIAGKEYPFTVPAQHPPYKDDTISFPIEIGTSSMWDVKVDRSIFIHDFEFEPITTLLPTSLGQTFSSLQTIPESEPEPIPEPVVENAIIVIVNNPDLEKNIKAVLDERKITRGTVTTENILKAKAVIYRSEEKEPDNFVVALGQLGITTITNQKYPYMISGVALNDPPDLVKALSQIRKRSSPSYAGRRIVSYSKRLGNPPQDVINSFVSRSSTKKNGWK